MEKGQRSGEGSEGERERGARDTAADWRGTEGEMDGVRDGGGGDTRCTAADWLKGQPQLALLCMEDPPALYRCCECLRRKTERHYPESVLRSMEDDR